MVVLAHLDHHSNVKVIVIRSKHPMAFCVGADVKKNFFDSSLQKEHHLFLYLERAFRSTRKPIVSVVQGLALGGGF